MNWRSRFLGCRWRSWRRIVFGMRLGGVSRGIWQVVRFEQANLGAFLTAIAREPKRFGVDCSHKAFAFAKGTRRSTGTEGDLESAITRKTIDVRKQADSGSL